MQLTRQDIQIIERVVTTEHGVFVARFAVRNVAGSLKARLVSMTPFYNSDSDDEILPDAYNALLLETPRISQEIIFVEPTESEIKSPYFELSFITTSISPRAPNR